MNHSEQSTTQGSTPNSTVLKLDQPSLASSLGVWDLRSDQIATMDIGDDPVKFRAAPRLPSTAANRPPVVIASMPRSQDKWELHRAEISALYENLPLQTQGNKPSVMSIMESRHSFFATPKQYKDRFSKWGLDKKNVKAKEMNAILRTVVKRKKHENKETEVLLHGKKLSEAKVKRALRRKRDILDFEDQAETDSAISPAIVCHTPPPSVPQAPSRSPSPLDALSMSLLRPVQYTNVSSPLFALCYANQMEHSPISKSLPLSANFSYEKLDLEELIDLRAFIAGLQSVEEEPVLKGRFRQEEEEKLFRTLSVAKTNRNIFDYAAMATTLDEIGFILQAQSRWRSAEIVLLRAALLHQSLDGNLNRTALLTLSRLAKVLNRQCRYGDAHDLYKFVWSSQLANHDAGTFYDSLETMLGLSGVFANQESLLEAEHLQEEILDSSKVIGETHPTTLKAIYLRASTRLKQGREHEAALVQRRGLSLSIQRYGEQSSEVIEHLLLLAVVERNSGNYNEAHDLLLRSLRVTLSVLGEDHEYMGQTIVSLARLHIRQMQFGIALEYGLQALDIYEPKLDATHILMLISRASIVESYLGLGQVDTAQTLCVDLLDTCNKRPGEEKFKDPHIQVTCLLGRIHFAAGRLSLAQQLLSEAFERTRTSRGSQHHLAKEIREHLVLVCRALEMQGNFKGGLYWMT